MADSSESTPEPAFKWGLVVPVLTAFYLATMRALRVFEIWTPSAEQEAALAGFGAPLALAIGFYTSWKVRKQVTPTVNVALTNKDVQLINAAKSTPIDPAAFQTQAHPGGNPDYAEA